MQEQTSAMRRCDICGHVSADVSPSLAKWNLKLTQVIDPATRQPVLPPDTPPYGSPLRCKDSRACRERTEAAGDVWPIDTEPGPPVAAPRYTPPTPDYIDPAAAESASVPAEQSAQDDRPIPEAAPTSTMFD